MARTKLDAETLRASTGAIDAASKAAVSIEAAVAVLRTEAAASVPTAPAAAAPDAAAAAATVPGAANPLAKVPEPVAGARLVR